MATEAVAAGADILVAQGTEAAGHGASRGTLTLVPEVVEQAAALLDARRRSHSAAA